MSPLSGWHQDSSRFLEAERPGSIGTEMEQSWSHQQDWEIDQFMQTFEQDVARDKDLGIPCEAILMDPRLTDHLEAIVLDELGLSSQSWCTGDQINSTEVACPELDKQISNSMCGKLCSIKPGQTLKDWCLHPNQTVEKYRVKRLGGSKILDTGGNVTDPLAMGTLEDVAAFIGCAKSTLIRALKRMGEKKGVIFRRWKAQLCKSTGADGGKNSVFTGAERSWPEQQIQPDYTVSEQDPPCTYGTETTLSTTCSTYTTSGHLEQNISHIPSNISHYTSSKDEESMSQLLRDVMEGQGSFSDEEHVRRHVYTDPDPHQSMPQSGILYTGHVNKHHTEVLKQGRPVKHYCVSQVDGHSFDFLGKTVSSIVRCTDKAVAAITGISIKTLVHAKKNVDILWAQWKVTLIKKAHCNHIMDQGLFQRYDTTLIRSEWSESNVLQSLQAYIPESSHPSLLQGHSVEMENPYEGYEASCGHMSTVETIPMHSLVSTHSIASAFDSQLSVGQSMVGKAKETVSQPKRKRGPLAVAHRISLQNSALNRPVSTATWEKDSKAQTKLYRVTCVNGSSFTYEGKQVASARIWSLSAVGELLDYTPAIISQALGRQGENKGIVKEVWRIENLGKAHRSA
jgi:hypothetical protein